MIEKNKTKKYVYIAIIEKSDQLMIALMFVLAVFRLVYSKDYSLITPGIIFKSQSLTRPINTSSGISLTT